MPQVRFYFVACLTFWAFPLKVLAENIQWTADQKRRIASLSLFQWTERPLEAKQNSWVGNQAAEELGALLFADKRMSKKHDISCQHCHQAHLAFSSPELILSQQHGPRSVPSLLGVGWQSFFFWDGRKDSLWAQAIEPVLNPHEHNLTAADVRAKILEHYRTQLEAVYGTHRTALISQDASGHLALIAFGKAISAYLSSLRPTPTRFDLFAEQISHEVTGQLALNGCEQTGLQIFLGKGMCINCHHGPLLSNDEFHNTGIPLMHAADNPTGRIRGISLLRADPYACTAADSARDPQKADCSSTKYLRSQGLRLTGAFKTPGLRNIEKTAPYMHNGSYRSLKDVILHYQRAADGPVGMTELLPLDLSAEERGALECFLKTL